MRTFARDEKTNDLTFGYYASKVDGAVIRDVDTVSGNVGILAVVESVVKTERGELALDTEAGIDHIGLLANGSSMMPFWKNDMKNAVIGCDHVVSVSEFDVTADRDSGIIRYRMKIKTDDGETATDGSIGLAKVTSYGRQLG